MRYDEGMRRRSFLHHSLAAAATLTAGQAFAALAADNRYRKNIGIQLYTLRNPIAKDVKATLKAVADAGYKQVELYGFPNAKPMMAAAKDAGLAVNSAHFEWDCVVNPKDAALSDFSRVLDQAKEAGLTHLVIPYLMPKNRTTLDDYKKVIAHANVAAAKAKEAGIQLAYHNHSFEFAPHEGGKSGFDLFVEEFSADMKFELDVFWVVAGGLDPVALLEKLKGRVTQLHLKDLKSGIKTPSYDSNLPEDAFQELGDGVIAMEPIIAAAEKAGVAHCHVEQDQSPDPLASIRQSMEYLRKM
jgi:sugar phosphate isomerase/epimerase